MSGKKAACRTPAQQSPDQTRSAAQAAANGFVRKRPVQRRDQRVPWLDLPTETRGALTSLIARLILEHLDKCQTGARTEAGDLSPVFHPLISRVPVALD